MTQINNTVGMNSGPRDIDTSGEINLIDYLRVIWHYKILIVGIVMVSSIIAVIASLNMVKIYRAEAVIIPISSGSGMSSLSSQLGGLAFLTGISGGSDDASKFITVLKSRTLSEDVITREDLMPVLFKEQWDESEKKWKIDDPNKQPTMENAVFALQRIVNIQDDKKSKTIKIGAVSQDRILAARVANAYVDELQNFINSNSFTMSKRNRIFIEDQLAQNKEDLLEAGKEINEFYKGERVSNSEAKVDVSIADNDLFVTNPQSPVTSQDDLADGHVNLDFLVKQRANLEQKISKSKVIRNVPQQVYLTYLMMHRDILAKLNTMLASQYEMAKIDEAKEDLAFQVIDKAVPPMQRFKPKRGQICMMAFMASLFFAIFLAFFLEYLKRMKSLSPKEREKLS